MHVLALGELTGGGKLAGHYALPLGERETLAGRIGVGAACELAVLMGLVGGVHGLMQRVKALVGIVVAHVAEGLGRQKALDVVVEDGGNDACRLVGTGHGHEFGGTERLILSALDNTKGTGACAIPSRGQIVLAGSFSKRVDRGRQGQ